LFHKTEYPKESKSLPPVLCHGRQGNMDFPWTCCDDIDVTTNTITAEQTKDLFCITRINTSQNKFEC